MVTKIKNILRKIIPFYIQVYIKQDILKREQPDLIKKRENFYAQFINKSDLVFDIGANIGNRIKIFLSLGAKTIAVEPQLKCVKYLGFKFGGKIKIVAKGAGAKGGKLKFFESNESTLSSFSEEWIENVQKSGRFSSYKWETNREIEITTIDELIMIYGKPNFIKIDIEGYEYEAIKGLSKVIDYISFEYAVPENKNNAVNCINKLYEINKNVRFSYSIGESMILACDPWRNREEILEIINSEQFEKTSCGDIYACNL